MPSQFFPFARSGAQALTTGGAAVRRPGAVALQLTAMTGGSETVALPFVLMGIGDLTGLRSGAIRRRHPAPGVGDMASELAVHVEFAAQDLPWRYAPDQPAGVDPARAMRPWLVLLAGAAADILPLGRQRVRVASSVLQAAPLGASARWAHVHADAGGGRMSRILSPCKLAPNTFCRAALVPAYRIGPGDAILDAWTGSELGGVEMPLYDTWTFTTAEDDDFPQLAALLRRVDAASLGPGFAQASVHIRQRREDVDCAGALMRPADAAGLEAAHSAALSGILEGWPVAHAAGRWVLAPPLYDQPWTAVGAAAAAWALDLRRDLRRRGAAGLGAWCAIDQQDQLVEGARRQAGAIDSAVHEVRMLGLGLASGRFLFERRLPPASDPSGRLAILGPLLRRMGATSGGTADAALRDHAPWLDPALLSGALRRMIRPGTALAAGALPGLGVAAIIDAANRCPPAQEPSRFTRIVGRAQRPNEGAVGAAIDRWRREMGDFARRAAQAAAEVADQGRRLAGERHPRECRRADLGRLAGSLAAALDPSQPGAPAIRRVRQRYEGLGDPFPAPVYEPELDLPLAPVIARLSPQWLLPGRGSLDNHRIVGLASNPRFIESALVGANARTLAELRWRNVRVASSWSPLRRFWPRPDGSDITPIRAWSGALADPSHRPAGDTESLLVFVIRSPILRRYPGTAIYLLKPGVDAMAMAKDDTVPPETDRVWPVFKGAMEPDLHYVGFPVSPLPPEQASQYALVLEEPGAEPRFRLEPPHTPEITDAAWKANANSAANGSAYAAATFHRRTIAVIAQS